MTENRAILPTDLKGCQLTYLHQLGKGMTVYNQGEKAQKFYYVRQRKS